MTYNLSYENETITLGCSIRNHPKKKIGSKYYLIPKNQIDDLTDRQVDLSIKTFTTSKEIKEQRSRERKGLFLIYALDPRGANLNIDTPIIGYSIHFPTIEGDTKVSYTASIYKGFDEEIMIDDDIQEID